MEETKPAKAPLTWTVPLCPFVIESDSEALEDIRMAVVSAFHRLAHGGLEVGGLLLGTISANRVCITGFVPVICEYAFGPSYVLSVSDHSRLSATITGIQAAGQTVVGWYHSHTSSSIFLSKEDLEIHKRHFKDPRQVALVLKPVRSNAVFCGFFFRESDGSIQSSESYQEFELGERTAAGGPTIVPNESVEAPAPELPARPQLLRQQQRGGQFFAEPLGAASGVSTLSRINATAVLPWSESSELPEWELQRQAAMERSPRRWRFPWPWALAVLMIVIAVGAAYVLWKRPNWGGQQAGKELATEPSLGLQIRRQGEDLVLTWDRSAPDMLQATAGLLSIKDGSTQKEIGLTADQLRSASILVSPQGERIEVQLTVLMPSHRTASEVGIVDLPPRNSTAPIQLKTAVPASTYAEAEFKSKALQAKAKRPFTAPSGAGQASEMQLTDDLPELHASEGSEQVQPRLLAVLGTSTVPFSSAAAAAPPAPAVSTEPESKNRIDEVSLFRTAQTAGLPRTAELISRKEPMYPLDARARHMTGGVVLEGTVGTDGRVKNLKVIRGLQVLRQAALDAVRQWKYRPAQLNGQFVESPLRVEVQFR